MADGTGIASNVQNRAKRKRPVNWREVIGLCAYYWGQQKALLGTVLGVIVIQILIDLTIPISSGLLVDRVIAALNETATFGPAYQALFMLSGATVAFHLFRWIRFHLLHQFLTKSMDH